MTTDPIDAIRERLVTLSEPGQPMRTMIRQAAAVTGVSEAEILSDGRKPSLCWVRFGIMLAASRRWSLARIGRALGRNHTTIAHGVRRARALEQDDPAFASLVALLA